MKRVVKLLQLLKATQQSDCHWVGNRGFSKSVTVKASQCQCRTPQFDVCWYIASERQLWNSSVLLSFIRGLGADGRFSQTKVSPSKRQCYRRGGVPGKSDILR
jgi:hypothetical protein